MLKLISAIILSLSFMVLLKECVVSMRSSNLSSPAAVEEKKQAKAQPMAANQAEKNVRFYPPVPAVLPDLTKGYLFNEERSLEGATEEAGKEEGEGQSVDMDTVFYAGSIIIGDMRKGLITYPAAPAPPRRGGAAARAGKIGPVLAPEVAQKQRNYQQLAVGDSFSGYKVAAVDADRIVFKKGGETVVKLLNDAKKTRIEAPAPQPPAQHQQPQKTPDANPAANAPKTNQAQSGQAIPPRAVQSSRPVQSSRDMRSARPVGNVTRTLPRNMIRVPGVPTASAPAVRPQRQPAPAPVPSMSTPQPQPTDNMPSQSESTN